ncbi:cytochrome c oxidase subunit II [Bacillaceae bacterium Marseille-Q3522]|nr:cytochrome c oxidase subunit II [Bacillaceae bacterium Marseille-Q3522]
MCEVMKWRLFSILIMLVLILTACGEPFLSTLRPAGEVAKTQYDLMILSTVIMVGVIVVVAILFILVIVKFRRKDDKIPLQVEGSHKLEITWTVIPIILLLVLAIAFLPSVFKLADTSAMNKVNEDGTKESLVVNVRSSLYWWEFEYPDLGIVTGQELVVPVDERVYFNLKASDVKHSFWVPSAGGKMDTNVEGVNKFYLEFDKDAADSAGNLFYGKCAELCGASHALMDFKVKAVSREEFDKWVKDMQAVTEPVQPETDTAKAGQEVFNQSCISCHAVTPANNTPEAARLAPNLTNFGERSRIAGILEHNEENLKKWLQDPERFKPGNNMTGAYQLTPEQLDAVTEYLMTLKVQE